jgi:phosphate:Na+ symporter
MFAKKPKIKCAGEIITGLAIIFVGMSFMGQAFNNDIVKGAFTNLFQKLAENPAGPLLLLIIGALFTGIIQSSSATTVMVVDMVGKGIIPVQAALFIVLGANIGTCITAALASIGTSTNARRAALIHLMFNIIGTLIFVPVIWPLQNQVASLLGAMAPYSTALQVAFFHLFFNFITTAILIGFRKQLVYVATKAIRSKKGEDVEVLKLNYIDEKIPYSIPVVGEMILKETRGMADLAIQNLGESLKTAYTLDTSDRAKIVNVEQKINFINREIGRYVVKLFKESHISDAERERLNDIHSVVSDIERIGDHAIDFLDEAEEMKEHSVKFTEEAVLELSDMYDKVYNMYVKAMEVFESRDLKRLDEIMALEREIDETKHDLGFRHIERLNEGKCTVDGGAHFYAVITALERVADHLTNIAFSIKTLSGAQLEDLKQRSKEMAKKRQEKKQIYW